MTGMSARSLGFTAKGGARIFLAVAGLLLACLQSAQALPSFARQTGQQCVACHNGFPELTPYGRQFKLNGYTFTNNQGPSVPLAALITDSYSHTQKALDAPITTGTSQNDNVNLDVALFFYGGRVVDHIGVYASGAYVPVVHLFSVGHTDIRYANSASLFGEDTTFGVAINNSPGQTDLWNSAQNFSNFPYDSSIFTPSPVASTAVQGRYASQVIGGNGYISWNQLLYASAGAYGGISPETLNSIGDGSRNLSPIQGAAPYWRLAVEPAWGHSTWEFGTFGMAFSAAPHNIRTAGTDRTVDVGFDTEYQYFSEFNSLSFIASYINEQSTFDASKELGFSSNSKDNFHTIDIKGTYTYDQTYSANLGYFRTAGSQDQVLYGSGGAANGRPNTGGWIGEIDYYPFNHGGPEFWRELGLKFALQYTYYSRFDGAVTNYDGLGRSASANNTLLFYTWTAL